MVDLSVRIGALTLRNPVIAASGCFGFGSPYQGFERLDLERLGAIAIKGTTPEPREGNPTPRLVETPAGLLNSIGLQNPGVEAVVGEVLPPLRELDVPIIANLNGRTVEDYRRVARRFDETGMADLLEVNISCPNVAAGGLQFGIDPEAAAAVVGAVREVSGLPMVAKLTPAAPRLVEVAQACLAAGAEGLSLVNTFRGMVIDTQSCRPVLGNDMGGLSGPAIRPLAVLQVHELYRALGGAVPIIGMGGIGGLDDALQFLIAGASAIQIGTMLFVDPRLLADLPPQLEAELDRRGLASLGALVGSLQLNREATCVAGGAR